MEVGESNYSLISVGRFVLRNDRVKIFVFFLLRVPMIVLCENIFSIMAILRVCSM